MHKLGELGENSRSNVRIFYMYLDVYFWAKMFIAYFDNEIEDWRVKSKYILCKFLSHKSRNSIFNTSSIYYVCTYVKGGTHLLIVSGIKCIMFSFNLRCGAAVVVFLKKVHLVIMSTGLRISYSSNKQWTGQITRKYGCKVL